MSRPLDRAPASQARGYDARLGDHEHATMGATPCRCRHRGGPGRAVAPAGRRDGTSDGRIVRTPRPVHRNRSTDPPADDAGISAGVRASVRLDLPWCIRRQQRHRDHVDGLGRRMDGRTRNCRQLRPQRQRTRRAVLQRTGHPTRLNRRSIEQGPDQDRAGTRTRPHPGQRKASAEWLNMPFVIGTPVRSPSTPALSLNFTPGDRPLMCVPGCVVSVVCCVGPGTRRIGSVGSGPWEVRRAGGRALDPPPPPLLATNASVRPPTLCMYGHRR